MTSSIFQRFNSVKPENDHVPDIHILLKVQWRYILQLTGEWVRVEPGTYRGAPCRSFSHYSSLLECSDLQLSPMYVTFESHLGTSCLLVMKRLLAKSANSAAARTA